MTHCSSLDEPTIGLHPLDVQTLLHVFDRLVGQGATVIVIEHDLDVISNCGLHHRHGAGREGTRVAASWRRAPPSHRP